MGAIISCSKPDNAKSKATVASLARLEAVAHVEAKHAADGESTSTDPEHKLTDGCRLAYSSVLAVKTNKEAQALLATVFMQALDKNPKAGIGGILFYDEQTSALVQVLEGPASAVRTLYNDKIKLDKRHTAVKLLWDSPAETRQYESFGMQLGSDPHAVLDAKEEMLQLTYISQLTATSRDAAYQDMQAILSVAIVTNPRLGIGGALFLNPRTLQVLQALEGPEANVRSLYAKIASDTRHKDCAVISELKVKERTYEQWGMLQGDLKDWSSLAAGNGGNVAARRRGRRAREDMDEGGEAKVGGMHVDATTTPTQAQALKGELQMTPEGKPVVHVTPAGDAAVEA